MADESGIGFGALVLPNQPWPILSDRWARLDTAGLNSIWSCDHFTNPHAPGQSWFEGIVSLAGMAQITTQARIGLLVGAIVSRPPTLLAKESLTLDHMSGGRLTVGLGAGGAPTDQRMWGVPDWSPRERVGRFEEYVALLDRLLRDEIADFTGHWYSTDSPAMSPGCLQSPRPPLLLAAHGPTAIRVAARHADIWNTYGPTLDKATVAMKALERACNEIGRDPGEIRRSVLFGIREETAWGTAEEFAALVRRWYDAGFQEFIFYYPPYPISGLPVAEAHVVDELLANTIPELRRELR